MAVKKKRTGWDTVALMAGMLPGVQELGQGFARSTVQRLLGFWVLWHLYGGLDAIIANGVNSTASAYRQRSEFVTVFGVDVEEFAPVIAAQIRAAGGGEDE